MINFIFAVLCKQKIYIYSSTVIYKKCASVARKGVEKAI